MAGGALQPFVVLHSLSRKLEKGGGFVGGWGSLENPGLVFYYFHQLFHISLCP